MPTCRKASCDAGIFVNGTPREAEERDGVSRKEGGEGASGETAPVGRLGRWSKGKSQRVWHGS